MGLFAKLSARVGCKMETTVVAGNRNPCVHRSRRVLFEALEPRILLSSVPTFAGMELTSAPGSVPSIAANASTVPVITGVSIQPISSTNNWQIFISGSGFGTQSPYYGDSPDLSIVDPGVVAAGNTGDAVVTNVTSWTNTQIVISGLSGAYGSNGWVISPGDTVLFSLANPQDGQTSATFGAVAPGTPPANPVIDGVFMQPLAAGSNNWQIFVSGSGFGTQSPFNGDSSNLQIVDAGVVAAGYTGDAVTVNVTSWTDSQIVISGLTGAYGLSGWVINPGDTVAISVANPESGRRSNDFELAAPMGSWSTATLSQARFGPAATSVGNLAIFAGGAYGSYASGSSAVDIYNAATGRWSTSTLPQGLAGMAATSVGQEAIFAGGAAYSSTTLQFGNGTVQRQVAASNLMQIYDATTGTWSTTALPQGLDNMAAVSIGSDAIFAGGLYNNYASDGGYSSAVQIYNTSTGLWSTAALSQARETSGLAVGNTAIFAGGGYYSNGWVASNVVDIYNASTGLWTTAQLSQPRYIGGATIAGNLAIFAGGAYYSNSTWHTSRAVDIYNATTGSWSTSTMPDSLTGMAATSVGDEAIFVGGAAYSSGNWVASRTIQIYNTSTGTWSVSTMPQAIDGMGMAATTVKGQAIFAGGLTAMGDSYSNAVVTFGQTAGTNISSVTASPGGQNNWTLTINGTGFGTQAAYNGDSSNLELLDPGIVAAGYVGDAVTTNVTSWTNNQIVISGMTGAYGLNGWVVSPGDTLDVVVINPQSHQASAPFAEAIPGTTKITGVTPEPLTGVFYNAGFTINGLGFGFQSPYNGASSDLSVYDVTQGFSAGAPGSSVTLDVTDWTNTQITIGSFTGASYGYVYGAHPGDTVQIIVTNSASGATSNTYSLVLPAAPAGTNTPTGLSPTQMREAYGLGAYGAAGIDFGTTPAYGQGETIAIVDVGNDPSIMSDANAFSSEFGLPQFNTSGGPTLTIFNQQGQTSNLPANGTWGMEESLDVQWAHVIAPDANIDLVEANSASGDLYTAVQTAANLPGVVVVSMSWGGAEAASETSTDGIFVTPSGHIGVTFLASTGDSGSPAEYPALSPNVIAVGGTTLTVVTNSGGGYSYGGEAGWSGSGGGISQYEPQPPYQAGKVNGLTSTMRAAPDVAMDADPQTGASVYDTYDFGTSSPWNVIGGTSLACPMWAAVIALVDQGRASQGLGSLNGATQTLPDLYSLPSSAFHNITTGSNGGYSAGPGYNLVTGLGSPVANVLVPDMVQLSSGTPQITSVSMQQISGTNNWQIFISGNNFGTQAAFWGDSPDLVIVDPGVVAAGHTGDAAYANVTSWSNTQIVISGLAGAYGSNGWVIAPGNNVLFEITNPQSGVSSGVFEVAA